jgi:hypothetical protein
VPAGCLARGSAGWRRLVLPRQHGAARAESAAGCLGLQPAHQHKGCTEGDDGDAVSRDAKVLALQHCGCGCGCGCRQRCQPGAPAHWGHARRVSRALAAGRQAGCAPCAPCAPCARRGRSICRPAALHQSVQQQQAPRLEASHPRLKSRPAAGAYVCCRAARLRRPSARPCGSCRAAP